MKTTIWQNSDCPVSPSNAPCLMVDDTGALFVYADDYSCDDLYKDWTISQQVKTGITIPSNLTSLNGLSKEVKAREIVDKLNTNNEE